MGPPPTGVRAEVVARRPPALEHVFHQQTPMGDLAVLVWEGVDPEQVGAHMADLMQNPASDHERYVRDHVVAKSVVEQRQADCARLL
jgi:hypothetical protein